MAKNEEIIVFRFQIEDVTTIFHRPPRAGYPKTLIMGTLASGALCVGDVADIPLESGG